MGRVHFSLQSANHRYTVGKVCSDGYNNVIYNTLFNSASFFFSSFVYMHLCSDSWHVSKILYFLLHEHKDVEKETSIGMFSFCSWKYCLFFSLGFFTTTITIVSVLCFYCFCGLIIISIYFHKNRNS